MRFYCLQYTMYILSIDVLWLKYLFFTSFRLSVYSRQRVDCNESDARFTITYTGFTITLRHLCIPYM
jgi:hypothetical protein